MSTGEHRQPVIHSMRHTILREVSVVLVLMLTAGVLASWYFTNYYSPKISPFNVNLGPAVTFAFGEGLKDPVLTHGSKIWGFINQAEPNSLSFTDVPHPMPSGPLQPFQKSYLYLITLVGIWWKFFGVSWSSLAYLVGCLAAISSSLTYVLFRLRTRRLVAILGTAAYFGSPSHLALLVSPRDYAKTPFFIAVFLLISILITTRLKTTTLLIISGLLGLIIGVGYGIRQDLNVVLAILPPVLIFFLPGPFLSRPLAKISALFLAVSLFIVSGLPMLKARSSISDTTSHHIIGGLFRYNDDLIGIGGAKYIWLNDRVMTDDLINTRIQDFRRIETKDRTNTGYLSVEYERNGRAYLSSLAQTFPADFLTRFYATIRTVINDGPWLVNGPQPTIYDARNLALDASMKAQWYLRSAWHSLGIWILFIGLVILSSTGLRLPLALLTLTIFFAGYPSLQFQPRHFGHLGIITFLTIGLYLEALLRLLNRCVKGQLKNQNLVAFNSTTTREVGSKIIRFAAIAALGIVTPLYLLRWYQHTATANLLDKYREAHLIQAQVSEISPSTDTIQNSPRRLAITTNPPSKADSQDTRLFFQQEYLAIHFDDNVDLPDYLAIPEQNIEKIPIKRMNRDQPRGPVTLFFSVIRSSNSYKIELYGGDTKSQISVASVANLTSFPNLITLLINEASPYDNMYQTIVG